MKKRILLAALALSGVQLSHAQAIKPQAAPGRTTVCYASSKNAFTHIAPPEKFLRDQALKKRAPAAANIIVTYNGFPADAKAAFQFAVDIWASQLKSEVPIHISATWTRLGSGVLGSARPSTFYRNVSGAPQANVWYPIALAEKLAGEELNGPTEADIEASFNSTFNWYLRTDGKTPAGKHDLVSVVLHELGHGLGFVDAMNKTGSTGSQGFSGLPVVYDTFVENATGQRLTNTAIFPNPSTALGSQITSVRGLYFNSPRAVAVNNNTRPALYAPRTFEPGSSIAHLDEGTYLEGDQNSLMTPQIGAAEAIHAPGPIMLRMFDDMGWFNTAIRHTPLRDTETAQDFVIRATIESDGTVKAGSTKLVYSIDNAADVTVNLTATGQGNEYTATIPNPGLGHTVRYYLTASDNETSRTYNAPGKPAPGVTAQERYTFKVGADVTAPEVVHEAPGFLFLNQFPFQLVVLADDNVGVASVTVEYSVNGVAQTPIPLTKTDEYTYTGLLNPAGIKDSDVITYRVVVQDVSAAQNKTTNPDTGLYTVNVVSLKAAQVTYVNELNSTAPLDFVGNGFSITTPTGFSNSAIHSTHPYPDGTDENDESNYIYQLLVPIRVRESRAEATVKFDEIVLVEPGEEDAVFGDAEFFDYVVVEGSKDGGTTWIPLADGYDARANELWLSTYLSAMDDDNNSTAVGTPSLFRGRTLNLRDRFAGGDVVQLRFRLFADQAAHGWGWAIDNVRIQDAVTGVADELQATGGFSIFPNPTSGRFTVQARLAKATPGLQVVVRNVLGQEVLRKAVRETPGQLHETIDLGGLANGLYLVSLGTGADALTKRVMVQK
ncbi:T9SS type A sorting domain-containing protein [Hymenobacter sp. J193]|uniref:T9SS type A sorting domain-containing protein n=1 Tax=Hymenobacter sp. J193 TaxID=2898429 RepID=UPI0021519C26|nr:T9SS type A sorting domain-containing protein [Hymenobacter sp. J193]MCR5888314.1 T9SS type A sorting domain-containing protein [Hymenobacter sp. J193]